MPALRFAENQMITYRRTWKGSIFSNVVSPVFFLLAMGVGLGTLVDGGSNGRALDGFDYLAWLAPGLLATTAMQTGAGEGSFPVMAGIRWSKTYHAALATPLRVNDIVGGHLGWLTARLFMVCAAFAIAGVAFGAMPAGQAAVAILPAMLTGLAHAAPITALAAALEDGMGLSLMFRFGIVPMFLFSGAFFPIEQLPNLIQPVAYALPLWHGVDLTRNLVLGLEFTFAPWVHLTYMAAWVAAGYLVAVRIFQRRLLP